MAEVITVEFGEGVHTLDALNAAAYRLIDVASCQIDRSGNKFLCHLTPKEGLKTDSKALRMRFLDYVTDESVRERLATKVEPVRNLILSLAFGALAASQSNTKTE
jgi:His-Xaa-Ser system protein HxsD